MTFRYLVLPSPGPLKNVLLSIWLGTIKEIQFTFVSWSGFSQHLSSHYMCPYILCITSWENCIIYHLSYFSLVIFSVFSLPSVLDCVPFILWRIWILITCPRNQKKFGSVRSLRRKSPLKQTLNRHREIFIFHCCKRNGGIHFCYEYHMP